jgi:hypothetical protein
LLRDVAALQAAVGVDSEAAVAGHTPGSQEHLLAVLTQLCEVLGSAAVTPHMVSTPEAAAATVSQLKRHVGIVQ